MDFRRRGAHRCATLTRPHHAVIVEPGARIELATS
jgi:hypothetical protein